jgi:sigma-B regulation protein RsbU (phosphoserine phosphatase)
MPRSQPPAAKILVVEDNELDALLLQEALKKAAPTKLDLTVAPCVVEAMTLLKQNKFHIVLLDLSLPDGTGLDTFTRLHAHAPETPIILFTGHEDEELGLQAVRAGAQEYIVKGTMNEKALWRVVSYAIERQALQRAVHESEERYKRLLTSVTDYIYTVQVEKGRAVSTAHGAGCSRVTGYTPEDFAQDPHLWHRMIHKEDRTAVLRQISRVLAGEPAALEHRIIDKSGAIRWVRNTPVLRRDDQDQLVGYDGLVSDITERKQAGKSVRAKREAPKSGAR